MVRNRKPKPEGKQRQRYSQEKLSTTISKLRNKEIGFKSVREAARTSGISRSTLCDYLKRISECGSPEAPVTMKKPGPPRILSDTEEKVLVELLSLVAKWGKPMDLRDIRVVVRDYLNSIPRSVPAFGPDNMPGEDWARSFMKRQPELSFKLAENTKRIRAAVSRES